jgi:hypothetical protein
MWDTYNVNGYRFHTEEHNKGLQTYNCGVCVRMVGAGESYYYGVLKEIYEYDFTNDAKKKLVLFKCDWYDPSPHGTKIDTQLRLVEIKESRKYPHYDPFVFAHQAGQVYYTRFPEGHVGWKSVIKITPRSVVANKGVEREQQQYVAPFQEEQIVGVQVNDADVDGDLRDHIGECLFIDLDELIQEEDNEICSSGRSDPESDADTSESEFEDTDED